MEIASKGYEPIELITIKGRVDSVEAPQLARALEAAYHRGKYKIVIDMSQLEYMSSAGLRALGDTQRNLKRHRRGEVILAEVPDRIRDALNIVGFDGYFTIVDTVSAALKLAAELPAENSATDAPPTPS